MSTLNPSWARSNGPEGPTESYLLVDFDNLNDRQGSAEVETQVSHFLPQALYEYVRRYGPHSVHVRLYGGWMASGVLSRRGSEVAAALERDPLLPMSHPAGRGVLRGTTSLAFSLVGHSEISWPDTYTEVEGPTRIRTRPGNPEGCESPTAECIATQARKFTKTAASVCPRDGCTVLARDAFFSRRQKMVDTLVACDLLYLAHQDILVGLVTSDLDFLPAIAQAGHTGRPPALIQPWRRLPPYYIDLLEAYGIRTFSLES